MRSSTPQISRFRSSVALEMGACESHPECMNIGAQAAFACAGVAMTTGILAADQYLSVTLNTTPVRNSPRLTHWAIVSEVPNCPDSSDRRNSIMNRLMG